MSKPRNPKPVKLIMSLLTARAEIVDRACIELTERFGSTDFISDALAFHYTDYYEKEFGRNLFRHIITFAKLINPDELASIKLSTNKVEDLFLAKSGKRTVNIDPGYIAPCHLILATCKGFAHRPYLKCGVYADLTLIVRSKAFTALEWTFPDYGSEEMIALFNNLRSRYLKQLRMTSDREGDINKDLCSTIT